MIATRRPRPHGTCEICGKRLPTGYSLTNHVRGHARQMISAWVSSFQPREGELLRVDHTEGYRFVDVIGLRREERGRPPAVRLVRAVIHGIPGRPGGVPVTELPSEEWVRRASEWQVSACGEWFHFERVPERDE